MQPKGNNELQAVMELCGHFLYHRRGGKRGQTKILNILNLKGEMAQKKLQEILNVQSGSMSEIVAKLESSGLITREKSKPDKRQINLKITEKGREVITENKKQNLEQEQKLFDALTNEEQLELLRLLTKLLYSWKVDYDKSYFEHRAVCSIDKP